METSPSEPKASPARFLVLLIIPLIIAGVNLMKKAPATPYFIDGVLGLLIFGFVGTLRFVKGKKMALLAILFLLLMGLMNHVMYNHYGPAKVWFDNPEACTINVYSDEKLLLTVGPNTNLTAKLRSGEHTIRITKSPGDSLIETITVKVIPGKRYLYNVLDRSRYIEGRAHYSERDPFDAFGGGEDNLETDVLGGHFFQLTQDYILVAPPSSIRIKKPVTSFSRSKETRTYIRRTEEPLK